MDRTPRIRMTGLAVATRCKVFADCQALERTVTRAMAVRTVFKMRRGRCTG